MNCHDTATAAAAPIKIASWRHLLEVHSERVHNNAWSFRCATAPCYLARVVEGHRLIDLFDLQAPGADDISKELRDMLHLEGQRLAVHGRSLPAQCAVGMSALRQYDEFCAAVDGGVDQLHRGCLLPFSVAGHHAKIGCLVAFGTEGPLLSQCIQDFRRCSNSVRVLHDLDRRHRDKNVRLVFVNIDLGIVLIGHPFGPVLEYRGGGAEWAAFIFRALGNFVQFVRNESGLEHAMPCLADQGRNIDAHWADQ